MCCTNESSPIKSLGGYDDFCQAFERDAIRKGLTHLSFTTISYDGVKPENVYITPNTRSPTVKEVLGLMLTSRTNVKGQRVAGLRGTKIKPCTKWSGVGASRSCFIGIESVPGGRSYDIPTYASLTPREGR